jgi:hypothetical protein
MPRKARVWLLLDPATYFTQKEAQVLWKWVQGGGTLIWADTTDWQRNQIDPKAANAASTNWLRNQLKLDDADRSSAYQPRPRAGQLLPDLVPLEPAAASVYWSGVAKATASGWPLAMTPAGAALEIAGTPIAPQLVRINVGRGQVFLLPDALLFTNYALIQNDNAILATNLVRAHAPTPGAVYFDERQHRDLAAEAAQNTEPNLLYYLWQPPLRWALLQLLAAGLLTWALYGRRLGAPVPIPQYDPVTRASQFAVAMGTLFQKVGRPKAAALTVGEEFRRTLARRVGLSPQDADATITERAALATGLPAAVIDRLLLHARVPREYEAEMLSDAQEMEALLRRLDKLQP